MSKLTFKDGDTYDLLYKKKNYEQEAEYVSSLIKNYNNSAKNLLEFGSGTGKHAKFLAKKGYSVHGIEYSHEMISKIKKV
jgi:cyclopropane fatty-acyl-phospholipid synthase-like methyltransferase